MALSVTAVSISVSPLRMDEELTDMFMTSAPSLLPASSNEAWVRVETSKNRLIRVRPRSELCFFSIWRLRSTKCSAKSRSPRISSRDNPSIPNRWRWLRTNVGFWAMFIKVGSIGRPAMGRKRPEGELVKGLWMLLPWNSAETGAGGRGLRRDGRPSGGRSVHLDAGVAHDLGPALDVELDLRAIRLRRAADRRESERRQPLAHDRQRHDARELPRQDIDDRPRRCRRRQQADIEVGVLVGEAAFAHGRHVGDDRRALRAGDRERAQRAFLDVRDRRG